MVEKNRIIWFALRCSDEDVTDALIKAQEFFGDDIRIVALRPVDEEEHRLIEETCKRTIRREDVARRPRQLDLVELLTGVVNDGYWDDVCRQQ